MTLQDAIDNLIAGCNTVGDVALKLSIMGCKGYPFAGEECPISNYLTTKDILFPEVCEEEIWAYEPDGFTHVFISMEPPLVLQKFIEQFDDGMFPQLIKEIV